MDNSLDNTINKATESFIKSLKNIHTESEKEEFVNNLIQKLLEEQKERLLTAFCEKMIVEFTEDRSRGKSFKLFSYNIRFKCLNTLIIITKTKMFNLTLSENVDEEWKALSHKLYEYMWYFKWILPSIPCSSNASIEHINFANRLMKDNYEFLELNLAMYYKTLMSQNITMGNIEKSMINYIKWQELSSKEGVYPADCQACEADSRVYYLYFTGVYTKAIEEAKEIINSDLKCNDVPHCTYITLIKCYIELGKIDEAKKLFPIAVELIDGDTDLIDLIPSLIEIATKLRQNDFAKELAVKYEDIILDKPEDFSALKYYIATSTLWKSHYDKALSLARIFDERNQNNYYENYLNKLNNSYCPF